MSPNIHDTLRDLGIGVGGPAGGLLLANLVSNPVVSDISIVVGILAGLSVIFRNALDVYKNHFKK
jgi:hypothetical protein